MGPHHETNYRRTWAVSIATPHAVTLIRHYVGMYDETDDETRSILPLAHI